MMYTRSARGSVLVMVIGLLTIVALLGSTFLIVSTLDAKQSRAMAAKIHADPIAAGAVAKIQSMLVADRYVNASGPYGGMTEKAWQQYTDYPYLDPGNDPAKHVDVWLAAELEAGVAKWRQLSRVYEDPALNVTAYQGVDIVAADGGPAEAGDTDGDGYIDAIRYDTGVTNTRGGKYYVVIRITDNAAKLCVNTAGRFDGVHLTSPIGAVNIDLRSFLAGTAQYDWLHADRCGSASQITADYNTRAVHRLLEPDNSAGTHALFAIGEEQYFRWFGPSTAMQSMRLYPYVWQDPARQKRLTTFNSSSAWVRYPQTNTANPDPEFTQAIYPNVLTDDAARQRTYRRAVQMFKELALGATAANATRYRKRLAAHMVANLWAMQSAAGAGAPWAFTPKTAAGVPETFTVYGLVPDLAITEAYAAHYDEVGDGSGQTAWAYALEIFNPTSENIPLGGNYALIVGGTKVDIPAGITAPARGRVVIGDADIGNGPATSLGLTDAEIAGWKKVPGLHFEGADPGPTVQLVRLWGPAGSEVRVPVDQVSASELGYSCTNKDSAGDTDKKDIRRNDTLADHRFWVGNAYVAFNDQTLGSPNGVTATNVSSEASFAVPVWVTGTPLSSLGDFGLIYLTGPIKDDAGSTTVLRPFSVGIYDSDFEKDFPDFPQRGRFDVHPWKIAVAGGWDGGRYPDVPWACLLGEFFTLIRPDFTRQDGTSRIYGRININTASVDVLKRLPFPAQVMVGGTTYQIVAEQAARYIVAYRDKTLLPAAGSLPATPDYRNARAGLPTVMVNLRGTSDVPGFLTAGEVAVPLGDYVNNVVGCNPMVWTVDKYKADYPLARDSLYRAVANLVTVNSDVFSANIRVELFAPGESPANPGETARYAWHYLAVLDRGNCLTPADTPAVLLFTQIK